MKTIDRWYRQLNFLYEITKTNIKMRNEGSALGFGWYFLDPMLSFFILLAVFSRHMSTFTSQYPLYLFLGIIHWEILAFGVDRAVANIFAAGGVIKSLKVRIELFVLSGVIFSFVLFGASLVIFFCFHRFFGGQTAYVWLYAPILLLQFFFTLAVALLVAAGSAYIHDMANIWRFLVRLWWLVTPVFYVRSFVADSFQFFYRFNPMYHFLEASRQILVYGAFPDRTPFFKLLILDLLLLVVAYMIFRKASRRFPELF